MSDRLRHAVRGGLFVLAPILIGLVGLDSLGSHHGDETNYIEVAAHMLDTGNYLVPVYHGDLVLDRALLFYWLIALSFRILGMSLVAARVPTLLATGVLGGLVYWFTAKTYGNARGAVYAAVATETSMVTCWICRLAVPDMYMTIGVFMAIAFFVRATTAQEITARDEASDPNPRPPTPNPRLSARRLDLFVASVGVGIAGMAKGHVGIVVAGLPLVVLAGVALRRRTIRLWDLATPVTWLPAVVMCGWWYVFLLTSHRLVIDFAPRHTDPHQTLGGALVQFLQAEATHQVEGGWTGLMRNLRAYPFGLLVWFLPWSLCVARGTLSGRRELRAEWRERPTATTAFAVLGASVFFLFTFLILEVRSMRYLLPITPAIAILAARYLVRREQAEPSQRRVPLAVLVGVSLGLLYHGLLGLVLPWAVRPPIEGLCRTLKPRLSPDDAVLSARIGDKWTTFSMALLARPVHSLDADIDATTPLEVVSQRILEQRTPTGATYLLTEQRTAEGLARQDPRQFRLLEKGVAGRIAEDRHLWEELTLIQVVGGD